MSDPRMNLGLLIPESGPAGIFGPSCLSSAELAVAELNQHGGLLGCEVTATVIDGGADLGDVVRDVSARVSNGEVEALVGWHTSALRREIVRSVGGLVPYIYTAVYEGGESSPGVFTTGEVPERQIVPALQWMGRENGITSWFVVGSDYVWPRRTAGRMWKWATTGVYGSGVRLIGEHFTPLGEPDFSDVLDEIEHSGADGVFVLLLGQDAVSFNRQFAARGLDRDLPRLGPLIDENMLLAGGAGAARELYSVSGFFESLGTGHSLEFGGRYAERFGASAPPLASPGESCYEGVRLLAELVERSASVNVSELSAHAQADIHYDSPRGHVCFRRHHLAQDVYMAKARGLEFDVLEQIAAVG
ncbi:substrate-binding domain-containing protein [Dietzia kunjamensis]|uniref:substrate-binding domain-containing protein n=1 Tax=Dietzia kunjamensis TaxID=322509 RepID=UPI0039BD6117